MPNKQPGPPARLNHSHLDITMNTLLVAIHGILTRQTDPSWPDRLDAWLSTRMPQVRVLKKEYAAGPFPKWNCWHKNPRIALGLANEIRLILDEGASVGAIPRLCFVAHSNGALIALLAARQLAAEGRRIDGMILIGAACEADVRRNGVMELIESGMLGRAYAYCSATDRALPSHAGKGGLASALYRVLAWPYGSLGKDGWLVDGGRPPLRLAAGRLVTRWFAGGHSGYFVPSQLEWTFRQIEADVRGMDKDLTTP